MLMDKALLMPVEKTYNESATDFNLFEYSLSLMSDANREIISCMESIGIITEAETERKGFNFDGILQAIVDAICNVLKYILKKILAVLVQLGAMGKAFEIEVRAFKDKLSKYHGYLRFEDYYEFTYIDDFDNYPNRQIVNTLQEDINNYIEKFKSLVNKNKTYAELQFNIANIKPDVDTDASVFRYELLGRKDSRYDTAMSDEIFSKECFKLFRNGQESAYETADIQAKHLIERIYEPYVKGGSNQRKIKAENERIQRDIKKAMKSIDRTTIEVSRFSISEQQTILQSYAQLQQSICELFNRKCKDIVTMYSAKLQAYKDFQVQSRRILTQAMSKVVQL